MPQEPPSVNEHNRVPAYWPSSSSNDSLIVVDSLEVKYSPELPAVLQNVSFTLRAGERVGLLGRTGLFVRIEQGLKADPPLGSGKSTLAMSILRFVSVSSFKPYSYSTR